MIQVVRNKDIRTRFGIVEIGPRGGIEIVKMEAGSLVLRRLTEKQFQNNWEATSLDPVVAATRMLEHMAGMTDRTNLWLRKIAFGEKHETGDQVQHAR